MRALEATLSLVFDDPEQFIDDLSTEILSLPPEERFTESVEIFESRLEREFGDIDAATSMLPGNSDQSRAFLDRLIPMILENILESVYEDRPQEGVLVIASALQAIDDTTRNVTDEELAEWDREILGSTILTVFMRIYQVGKKDAEEIDDEDVIRDCVRAQHYLLRARGHDGMDRHPDEMRAKEVYLAAIRNGAASAYRNLDITISRGAELANMNYDDFRTYLEQLGVDLNHGPSSADDLFSSEIA